MDLVTKHLVPASPLGCVTRRLLDGLSLEFLDLVSTII